VAFFRPFDRSFGHIDDDELELVVGSLQHFLARQLEGSAPGQNIFHPSDGAPDARFVDAPAFGEVEEGAILAPVCQSHQDLILDHKPGRSPRDAPLLMQMGGDGLDHLVKGLRLHPAVAPELRGRSIFDLFVAHQCDSC